MERLGWNVRSHIGLYSLLGMFFGLISGYVLQSDFLGRLIPLTLFAMLFPAFLDIEWAPVFYREVYPLLTVTALIFNFIVSPLLMSAIITGFSEWIVPDVAVGLLMFGMMPVGGMGPAYTGMLKGNMRLSTAVTAGSLILSLGAIPFWSSRLIGNIINVPLLLVGEALVSIIVLPMALALLVKHFIIRFLGRDSFDRTKIPLRDMSGLGLIFMNYIIFTLHGRNLIHDPSLMAVIILPTACFSSLMLFGATMLSRVCRLTYGDASAFTINTTLKNSAIAMALATSIFGGKIALVIAVAGPMVQLPIILGYVKLHQQTVGKRI